MKTSKLQIKLYVTLHMTVCLILSQSQYKVWIRFGEVLELGERWLREGGNRDLNHGVNIIILHILIEQHGQVYGGSALRILSYPKSTPPCTGQADMSHLSSCTDWHTGEVNTVAE